MGIHANDGTQLSLMFQISNRGIVTTTTVRVQMEIQSFGAIQLIQINDMTTVIQNVHQNQLFIVRGANAETNFYRGGPNGTENFFLFRSIWTENFYLYRSIWTESF